MSNFNKVKTFMKTFGQEVKTKPSFSTDKINILRYDLIKEELEELKVAMESKDLLEVADALTDILYVTYGAGHAFGINLDQCFNEVQNSNMSTHQVMRCALLIVAMGTQGMILMVIGRSHLWWW